MFTFSAFSKISLCLHPAVRVIILPCLSLALLAGCVTAEGEATLAPLRPPIQAEKSPEKIGRNKQEDIAAAASGQVTPPASETATAETAATETAATETAIAAAQDTETETADAGGADTLAPDALNNDEMTALPGDDETLIAAVLPPPTPEPAAEPAPEPEPEPELPPELDPESLIGSTASDVERQLGQPVLRRLEGTTEVWQYRMESCIIDFVLPEGTTVLAWNSRHRQHGQTYDALSCRRDLALKAGL